MGEQQLRMKSAAFLPLLFVTCWASVLVQLNENISIQGVQIKDSRGNMIDKFTGIHYATRKALFSSPDPMVYPEKKILIDATSPGKISMDFFPGKTSKTWNPVMDALLGTHGAVTDMLNCQTLDIFRHSVGEGKSGMSVFVYVHGGLMVSGSRQQGFNSGDEFLRSKAMAEDVILVSVDYSLGPLGFWYSHDEDERLHANGAAFEIIESLRWVQAHIACFGGDPQKVTLGGHSAGAALAQTVQFMLADIGKHGFATPPFQKLLLMSGTTILFPAVTPAQAKKRQDDLVSYTRCGLVENPQNMLACLRSLSEEELYSASENAMTVWGPVVDGDLLEFSPEEHLQTGKFMRVEAVLLTFTSKDSGLFCIRHKDYIDEKGHECWERLGQGQLVGDFCQDYPASSFCSKFDALVCSSSDVMFVNPAIRSAELYKTWRVNAEFYEFDFELAVFNGWILNEYSYFWINKAFPAVRDNLLMMKHLSATHGLEQALIFNAPLLDFYIKLRISSISTATQETDIVSVVFDFITLGTVGVSTPPRVVRDAAKRVAPGEIVLGFYEYEYPRKQSRAQNERQYSKRSYSAASTISSASFFSYGSAIEPATSIDMKISHEEQDQEYFSFFSCQDGPEQAG